MGQAHPVDEFVIFLAAAFAAHAGFRDTNMRPLAQAGVAFLAGVAAAVNICSDFAAATAAACGKCGAAPLPAKIGLPNANVAAFGLPPLFRRAAAWGDIAEKRKIAPLVPTMANSPDNSHQPSSSQLLAPTTPSAPTEASSR